MTLRALMDAPRPFLVAEVSANHLGSLDRAINLVRAAAEAGADAIKLQTWSPDTMCVDQSIQAPAPWAGSLRDLYRKCWTPWDWHTILFAEARERGMLAFSAAFDLESVDFLETLDVPMHKVASPEITDLPLIRHMASKGKPMILSAGMATLPELVDAVRASTWGPTVLHCVSAYPAAPEVIRLATLRNMIATSSSWEVQWPPQFGLSDHSVGIGVAVAATALGAVMIEKHLTLSRADGGPDAAFSMEPAEFAQMATECRRAAAAIGEVRYGPTSSEQIAMRRSLWVVRKVATGDQLVLGENIRTARPNLGLPCNTDLKGLVAARELNPGEPLTEDCLCRYQPT